MALSRSEVVLGVQCFSAVGAPYARLARPLSSGDGDHIQRQIVGRLRLSRKRPGEQTTQTMDGRLLEIVVYGKRCRIGAKLTLDDLAETAIGDWKMPDFRMACSYAAAQGWLIVADDALTLTTAGLAAA
jgi:hypothetical protein